jgi:hypothetical protein
MLSQATRSIIAEAFAPYLQGHRRVNTSTVSSVEENAGHIQQIGEFMQRLLGELKEGYSEDPVYQVLERVFNEHFRVEGWSGKGQNRS